MDYLKNSLARLDREVALGILFQPIAILLTLATFRAVSSNAGSRAIVATEALLSLTSFMALIIDGSTSTFYSRKAKFFASQGMFGSIVAGRLGVSVIVQCILVLVSMFLHLPDYFVAGTAIVLCSFALDISWYIFGIGKSFFLPIQSALRSILMLTAFLAGLDAVIATAIAYLITQLLTLFLFRQGLMVSRRISIKVALFPYKQYALPTLTDMTTSVFSKLDGFLVALLFTENASVIYLASRKYMNALLTVVFSGIKTLYSRPSASGQKAALQSYRTVVVAACLTGSLMAGPILKIMAPAIFDKSWVLPATILTFVLLVGYWKNQIVFTVLYVKRAFHIDFYCALFSGAAYLASVYFISMFSKEATWQIALARVAVDAVYIMVALMLLKYANGKNVPGPIDVEKARSI
jgi:hypothetical protein